jgi:hypothetical protein
LLTHAPQQTASSFDHLVGGLEVHDHPIGIPILTVVRAQMSDEPNVAALGHNVNGAGLGAG